MHTVMSSQLNRCLFSSVLKLVRDAADLIPTLFFWRRFSAPVFLYHCASGMKISCAENKCSALYSVQCCALVHCTDQATKVLIHKLCLLFIYFCAMFWRGIEQCSNHCQIWCQMNPVPDLHDRSGTGRQCTLGRCCVCILQAAAQFCMK